MKLTLLPKVSLIKEVYGANIILGIISNHTENIERFFNFLHNYGAAPHGGELEWMNEDKTFAKIQLDEDRLISAYQTYYSMFAEHNLGLTELKAEAYGQAEAEKAVGNIGRDVYLKDRRGTVGCVGSSEVKKNGHLVRA